MTKPTFSPAALTFRIFLPFAFGYFLSYLFRVVNAVIAPDLISEMDIGPDTLGLLTAAYFITFAAFQIPLGVLLDKYGPRVIEASLLIFAALGAIWFALASSSTELIGARALIGFGVSACLMASFKAFTVFFSSDKLPLTNGLIMTAGGLGALAGTAPTEYMVQLYDWRGVFLGLSVLTVICSIYIFLSVPDPEKPKHQTTLKEQLEGVKAVFSHSLFWRLAPLTMTSQATFISVQSLWVGPWHSDVMGLERNLVANELFWIAFAMVAGFLGLGALSERLSKWNIATLKISLVGIILFMFAQIGIIFELAIEAHWLWLCFGFFGTTGILNYAVLSQNFPTHLSGRVNTAINMVVFVFIFLLQWVSGAIIDQWPVTETGSYEPMAYQVAFGFFLVLQVIAMIWCIWPRRNAKLPL